MAPSSLVAAAVPAVRVLFVAALPVDFPVSVGPPPGGDVPSEFAAVAYGGDNRPGVVGRAEPPRLGNAGQQSSEEFVVWCTISTASGDQDADVQLSVTSGHFASVASAVRADRRLGGLIVPPGYADIGSYEWVLEEGGNIATVFFQVAVTGTWLA